MRTIQTERGSFAHRLWSSRFAAMSRHLTATLSRHNIVVQRVQEDAGELGQKECIGNALHRGPREGACHRCRKNRCRQKPLCGSHRKLVGKVWCCVGAQMALGSDSGTLGCDLRALKHKPHINGLPR